MIKTLKTFFLVCWMFLSFLLIGNVFAHLLIYAIDGTVEMIFSPSWGYIILGTAVIAVPMVVLLIKGKLTMA